MNIKDLTYNNKLHKIKNMQPILDDPDGLTDLIVDKIEQLQPIRSKNRLMLVSSILSGAAASILVCFFVYETIKYPVIENTYSEYTFHVSTPHYLTEKGIYLEKAEIKDKEEKEIIELIIKKKKEQQAQKITWYTSYVHDNLSKSSEPHSNSKIKNYETE